MKTLRNIGLNLRNSARRLLARQSIEKFPPKLHLGCGPVRLPGYCNVDIAHSAAADILDNVATLNHFPDNYAEEIYACHVLEHFSHVEIPPILKRWHAVLKPGGVLRISVPDIDRLVKVYTANWQHFQTPGNSPRLS